MSPRLHSGAAADACGAAPPGLPERAPRDRPLLALVGLAAAAVVGGALVAPGLARLGAACAAAGYFPVLGRFALPSYLARAALALAFLLAPALLRVGGVASAAALGLGRDARRVRHLATGAWLGAAALAAHAMALWLANKLAWVRLPTLAEAALAVGTGVAVAVPEELLFRGVLFGCLRRALAPAAALWLHALIFAALHFVRAGAGGDGPPTQWDAGLRLLPHLFGAFAAPRELTAAAATLTAVGLTLGATVLRTGSLYAAIGLHAAWVAGVKALSTAARVPAPDLWLAGDWRGGLAPLAAVLLVLMALRWALPAAPAAGVPRSS